MTTAGRSAYARVRADELDINDQILVTFDQDKIPETNHNPGLHTDSHPNEPFISGKRIGALLGTISIFEEKHGLVWITTEHGTVRAAARGCPVWRVRTEEAA